MCVNVFNSFNLAENKYELNSKEEVKFISILIQDHAVSSENQQEAVVSWAAQ